MSTQIQIEKDNLAYSVERAQFDLAGTDQVLITVFDDEDEATPERSFGPYQTDTAIHWSLKARSAAREGEDPIALLKGFDAEFTRRMAGNDWTGLLPRS